MQSEFIFITVKFVSFGEGWDLPCGSVVKNPADSRDMGPIPGSRRFPGEGNGSPLSYSYLENPTDKGASWTTVHGVMSNTIINTT